MGDANGIPGLELWPESAPAIVSIWGMILQVKELSFPLSSTGNSDFQTNTFKKKWVLLRTLQLLHLTVLWLPEVRGSVGWRLSLPVCLIQAIEHRVPYLGLGHLLGSLGQSPPCAVPFLCVLAAAPHLQNLCSHPY